MGEAGGHPDRFRLPDGAQQVGVKLTYEQVVAQFCLGVDNNGEYITPVSGQAGFPPGAEDIRQSSLQQENNERCGSVAAWATATKDGKVIWSTAVGIEQAVIQ